MKKEDRHRGVYIPFRCTPETEGSIQQIAAQQHRPKSEVLRHLVERGLVAEGYKQDEDGQQDKLQQAIQDVIKPHVERLAAISAKATQISSAAFFMELYTARLLVPPGAQREIEEVAGRARKLGIEYLKLKDPDIDTFLQEGMKKIADEID